MKIINNIKYVKFKSCYTFYRCVKYSKIFFIFKRYIGNYFSGVHTPEIDAYANNWSKMPTSSWFKGLFEPFWSQFKRFFAAISAHWWNMDPPIHTGIETTSKTVKTVLFVELRFELLSDPPNYPDLSTRDFYLFLNLKRWLQGQRFSSNGEVKWETNVYFGVLDKSYYTRGIGILKSRWT